ncbi:MAG: MinD/ParA family protein [Promethearchaeota archaeon]
MTSVMTITSTRGGVGKSSLCLELAVFLCNKGKVLLIDADFYSPSLFTEINARTSQQILEPDGYFRDILRDFCSVSDACIEVLPTLHLIFSDPHVNLWELSKDIGTKCFWIDDDPSKPSPAEAGLTNLRNYVQKHLYDYVIFDTMAGFGYPVVYLSYISTRPVFISRPSIPQVTEAIGFINLIGTSNRPVQLIWGNVPSAGKFMSETRQKLENQIQANCGDRFRILGFIPRDPEFEQTALLGNLTLFAGKSRSQYHLKVQEVAQKFLIF